MDVSWLEQREADLPASDDWLSAPEKACSSAFKFAKRRRDWRLGRWTAKNAVAVSHDIPGTCLSLAMIEIVADPTGRPRAFFRGHPAPAAISISHRDGLATCAVAASGTKVGCDLELIENRTDAFLADYFTPVEVDLMKRVEPDQRMRLATLLWSAKESALKAIGEGLRLDTRSVSVTHIDHTIASEWSRLTVRSDTEVYEGWWRESDGIVRTIVADPAPGVPISSTLNHLSLHQS